MNAHGKSLVLAFIRAFMSKVKPGSQLHNNDADVASVMNIMSFTAGKK